MTAAPPTTDCPYIGLRFFEERDAELFYGRDEHIAELLAKLSSNRFVAVLGSSGSGKSSLVRAGLLPELRAGMIPHAGPRWKVIEFQPKNAPSGELARSLQETLSIENAHDLLAQGPLGLVNAIRAARLDPRTNVLVIADQFEEVFRFQREAPEQNKQAAAEECQALVRCLLDAASSELTICVLIVMRSDYLGDCSQFPDLPERMSESLYLVPRLRRDQLEQAIVTPAAGDIEPALVQRFLSDAGADQDQLPRLQHLLMRLWMAHRLTMDGYKHLGGYHGALADHLNHIYNGLTANQQKACQRIFQRLSDRDDNNRDVRRRATVRELTEVCGPREDVFAVLKAFRDEGFLRPAGELHDNTLIDLTHECILRGWDKLTGTNKQKGWLQEEVEARDFYLELRHRSGRSKLTGADLRNATQKLESSRINPAWARRYGSQSDYESVRSYIARSEKRARLLRLLIAILGIALVAVVAYIEWLSKSGERRARARELTAYAALSQTEDPARALFLGWQAAQLSQPLAPGLIRVLDSALFNGPSRLTMRGHHSDVTSVAWSPDGKSLASAGADGTVKLWDADTGQELHTLRGHESFVMTVAWSPDGKSLASAGADHTVKLRDASTGQELRTLRGHQNYVDSVAWSPDGKFLASASWDKTVKLWDAGTGQELRSFRGHQNTVSTVAWSPDGKSLASASYDNTVKLWDPSTGQELRTLRGHQNTVSSVAWSPDGKSLASSSADDTVKQWDAATGQELRILHGHQNYVNSVAWSLDGKHLASASADHTLKLWDASTGQKSRTLQGHQNDVTGVAWSPDGKLLASASADKTVKLWDAGTGQELRTLRGHQNIVNSVAWSPDGKSLASASSDNTVKLWDAGTGQELRTLRGHRNYVDGVAWSPDGKLLVTASYDTTVKLWDASTGQELRTLRGHQGSVTSVAWSPDGKSLASASWDKTVKLWHAHTTEELRTLRGHQDSVLSVAWSPDAKFLASASEDHTVKVWDASTGQELRTLRGHQDSVTSVAWSPDAKSLASAGQDGTIRIYPINADLLLNLVRDRIRQVILPKEECRQYFNSDTCPAVE